LEGWGKGATRFDAFLNILLFIPFGFAISNKFLEKHKSRATALLGAFALGALLSYSIEFLQIYVPSRDSGWGDILTNTAGAVTGFLIFELCGAAILGGLFDCEAALARFLTWPRSGVIIFVYLAFWLAISVPLQKQTRFNNWDPFPLLLIGNDASGDYGAAWEGNVYGVQLWNRPLSATTVEQMTALKNLGLAQPGLLASYDFSAPLPLRDQLGFLPQLFFASKSDAGSAQGSAGHSSVSFDGSTWLTSRVPPTNFVLAMQKTNQFTIRVVCRPKRINDINAAIVSFSGRSGIADLELLQDDSNVDFVFRNSIALNRYSLGWFTKDVFATDRTRDLVFVYDGNSAFFYLDGQPASYPYRLGPGPALARHFRHIKTGELDGYSYIYYSLIFFVVGVLMGISKRSLDRKSRAGLAMLLLTFFMPALILEAVLVFVSGKVASWSSIALSIALMLAGSLWINADSVHANAYRTEPPLLT